jgi:hypothetical protein
VIVMALANQMRRLVMLVLLIGLSACSAPRVAFDALPYWLQWEAKRTWDLDEPQANLSREQINQWLEWARREQMRPTAQWLQGVRRQLRDGPPTTPADVTRWRETITQWWAPLVQRITPDLITIAITLKPAQVTKMRVRFDEGNERWRRDIHPASPKMRAARREERWIERTDWLFGEVTAMQRELIRAHIQEIAAFDALVEAERMARQQRIVVALEALANSSGNRDVAVAAFTEMLDKIWRPSPARAEEANRLALANDAIAARLLASATPAQRAALDRRISGFIDDLNTLAARNSKGNS